MRFFQKQFEKAFCPRNEFANLQKKAHLRIEKKVIGLIYRWKTRVFWKFIKKSPYSDFHFRCSKTPLHVTFLHFFQLFFFKISPTSQRLRFPPIFTIDLSPLIILFSPSYEKRFLFFDRLFKKKKKFNMYLWFQKKSCVILRLKCVASIKDENQTNPLIRTHARSARRIYHWYW